MPQIETSPLAANLFLQSPSGRTVPEVGEIKFAHHLLCSFFFPASPRCLVLFHFRLNLSADPPPAAILRSHVSADRRKRELLKKQSVAIRP